MRRSHSERTARPRFCSMAHGMATHADIIDRLHMHISVDQSSKLYETFLGHFNPDNISFYNKNFWDYSTDTSAKTATLALTWLETITSDRVFKIE